MTDDAWPRASFTDANSHRQSPGAATAEVAARHGTIIRIWSRLQSETPGYVVSLASLLMGPGWLEAMFGLAAVEESDMIDSPVCGHIPIQDYGSP